MQQRIFWLTIILLSYGSATYGQQEQYTYSSSEDSLHITKIAKRLNESDQAMAQKILLELYKTGHLEANYRRNDNTLYWTVGATYQWASLGKGNLSELMLSQIGYRQKFFNIARFSLSELNRLFNRVIKYADENGYPFASIKLDSVALEGSSIRAVLDYSSGPQITFGELKVIGSDKIKSEWLQAYLNLKIESPFNQKKVDQITSRIENLDFVRLTRAPEVIFKNLEAEVNLYVENVQANSVDGIIGFFPNEEDGNLLLTGQLFLNLDNLFQSGKHINLEWQSVKPRTQLLNASYFQPNILKTPFHLNFDFALLKEDSLFVNRSTKFGISRQLGSLAYQISYNNRSSSVLSTEVDEELFDYTINYYSIGISKRIRPDLSRRYWMSFQSNLSAGIKKIDEVAQLNEEIASSSTQYDLSAVISSNLKLIKTLRLANEFQAGKLINDNLLRNDMYRIGGLRSLRGFNENNFFASEYFLVRNEVRYYYQPDSYFFGFFDWSYLHYQSIQLANTDYPSGFGAGLSLGLNNATLNIVYALGRSEDQPLDTRLSKIHFGYLARF